MIIKQTHYTNFATRPELGSNQIEVTTVCASLRTVVIIIWMNNSYLVNETTLNSPYQYDRYDNLSLTSRRVTTFSLVSIYLIWLESHFFTDSDSI